MKKYIYIFVSILILGSLAIALPYFLSSSNKQNISKAVDEAKKKEVMKEISSNSNTVNITDIPQDNREAESYDNKQMYFEGVENLYKHLKFAQVEELKQRVQSYIHTNISNDILDCYIVSDSIKKEGDMITFLISLPNSKTLELDVIHKEGESIDISITTGI